jgi:hypothetical protein
MVDTNFGGEWTEVEYRYSSELKERYDNDNEFDHWFVKYMGRWPFHPSILNSKQIPHSHSAAVKDHRFFNELYMSMRYLDAGYEVHLFYRGKECGSDESYKKAVEVLGNAYKTILRFGKGGEPPDLLVVQPGTTKFRFVECKGPSETPTENQIAFFRHIEESLDNSPPPCGEPLSDPSRPRLFPPPPEGHLHRWINIVRVAPSAA